MREPPRSRDRLSIALTVGRHLEDVAVRLLQREVGRAGEVGADVGSVDRLLAGDPRAPRHHAAAAVEHRPVQARVAVHHLAEPGHLDRGRAGARHGVVRRTRPERRSVRRVGDLVVPHEDEVAVGALGRRPCRRDAQAARCRRRGSRGTPCRGTTGRRSRSGDAAAPARPVRQGWDAGRGRARPFGSRSRRPQEALERTAGNRGEGGGGTALENRATFDRHLQTSL